MLRFAEAFWKICENEVSSHDDIGHLLWPSVECGRSGGMPLDLRCEECKTLEERLEEAVTGLVLFDVSKSPSLRSAAGVIPRSSKGNLSIPDRESCGNPLDPSASMGIPANWSGKGSDSMLSCWAKSWLSKSK